MGTRSSRLQEEGVSSAFEKDDISRGSCRRLRSKRPTSLVVGFSGSFDQDSEAGRSRSEEGSDSDQGRQASASGGSANRNPGQTETVNNNKHASDGSPTGELRRGLLPGETGRVGHRTFSERLVVNRQISGRNGSVRPGRARTTHPRPVSEAWIGRVSNRHGTIRCPFCSKPFPGGRIEDHLLSCLTSLPLPYNTDTLTKDSGECSICLEDLLQGDTIARLACLCVYHKSCIDSWSKVKSCCPEHPFN
ncbi:E3 ubiquitin-protein ligase ZNRF2 [Paramormyrops kingsleyae]|uniref:E3 ubiquitin-protein ligase ZNRF1 n=1 Tax=Paramormyrops kingsleyae TaxID=1676925 RepID=A0A3B3S5G5_9TELE|nr:E3 ubiquitin-protein ligase ZNRF1-like [Paramormyrops kingsleyae]